MTLRARFTLAITGLIVVLFLVLVLAASVVERQNLMEESSTAQRLKADHLAFTCNDALITKDELGLVDLVQELKTAPEFVEAACVNREGRVLIHSDLSQVNQRRMVPAMVKASRTLRQEGPDRQWVYAVPVQRAGKTVAVATLVVDARAMEARVRELTMKTVRRLAGLTAGVMVLGLLLSSVLAGALTRPLRDLAVGARRIGQGQLGTRVREGGPGEIGEVAQEFNSMAKKLGDLETMKDQFIHSVSHDLRNPLSAIATSAQVLQKDGLPEASRPLVEVIETSAVRLRTMVNNILDTAKMREGRLSFDRTRFPAANIVRELARLYQPLAQQSGKTLLLEIPPDLPYLNADEEKVLRIFLNLLTNAFKFTWEGGKITLSAAPAGPGWVEFRVSDNGVGIDPAQWAQAFEPFRAAPGATQEVRRRQGTGLGLAIVKSLVEGHGGTVRLESALGRGTTVVFTLPTSENQA